MADIAITAANVVPGADSKPQTGVAGVAVTAGQVVYQDAATGKFLLADNDSATVAAHKGLGIALNNAAANQPLTVHVNGDITIGGVLVAGVAYYLSATPGGICPVADLVTGKTVCLLGMAKSTTVLDVEIEFPGVTL